jgi:hypothetical protein
MLKVVIDSIDDGRDNHSMMPFGTECDLPVIAFATGSAFAVRPAIVRIM